MWSCVNIFCFLCSEFSSRFQQTFTQNLTPSAWSRRPLHLPMALFLHSLFSFPPSLLPSPFLFLSFGEEGDIKNVFSNTESSAAYKYRSFPIDNCVCLQSQKERHNLVKLFWESPLLPSPLLSLLFSPLLSPPLLSPPLPSPPLSSLLSPRQLSK